jgi:hypothetical protein
MSTNLPREVLFASHNSPFLSDFEMFPIRFFASLSESTASSNVKFDFPVKKNEIGLPQSKSQNVYFNVKASRA